MPYTKYTTEDIHRQRRRRAQKRTAKSRAWRVVRILIVLGVLLAVVFLAMAGGVIYALARNIPQLDELQRRQNPVNTVIYDRDGQVIAELHGAENRIPLASNQIPQLLKDATVAVEDQRFYEHHGVDFTGVMRAFVENLRAGDIVQGGSTITAQLIKNAYLDTEQSYTRKMREAVLSWQLEDRWSKDRILTEYLNTVYYGAGAYGVEAAARTYFHKSAKKLTLKEAALLAALPRFPSQYSPVADPKLARERRDIVLDTMASQGYITEARAAKTKKRKLGVFKEPLDQNDTSATYFVDYVTRQLIKRYGTAVTFGGGLKVHTSIDLDWQAAAIKTIKSTIGDLDFGFKPAGALVAVEPKTGYIRAMVGGVDFEKQKFNLAWQARRQAGSAMKPFVLSSAVTQGMNPRSTYYTSHSPTIIPLPGGQEPWVVNTYSGGSAGRITVERATWISDNTVYAQLIMDSGPSNVVRLADAMGINSKLQPYPSLTLGAQEVNPLEMTSAYATLASGGVARRPQAIVKVVLPSGKVDWKPKTKGQRAMSEGEAYVITQVLKGVASGGTGAVTGSYYPYPRAGKTGTTDDYVDAWYCGYTPALSVSVWMGYPGDYLHPMPGVAGGTYCAPMWGKFMQAIGDDLSKADFPPPDKPMVFKPWKGMYATMSPSASESATPTPTATKTIKPTPAPTATKTIKPTPTPTPTATSSVGAQAVTILAAAGEADPPPYDGLLGWLGDLFSGIF